MVMYYAALEENEYGYYHYKKYIELYDFTFKNGTLTRSKASDPDLNHNNLYSFARDNAGWFWS